MGIRIQQVTGKLYLHAPNRWVAKKEEACVFDTSSAAINFCIRYSITGVCLVSEDSGEETHLYPFGKGRGTTPRGTRSDR